MNPIAALFERRIRGFRVVEVVTFALLIMLVLWVYLAKAGAARERSEIAQIEQRIGDEQRKVKSLRAEAAKLEQPARLEALSETYLKLAPVSAKQEARPDRLDGLADRPVAKAPDPAAAPAEPAVKEGVQ
ncbi:MAG: cell division protein [Proteobacteria bacterium]|nr:cell division protein [Pseudomonadota bacterium]